jgi:hypothetical protein
MANPYISMAKISPDYSGYRKMLCVFYKYKYAKVLRDFEHCRILNVGSESEIQEIYFNMTWEVRVKKMQCVAAYDGQSDWPPKGFRLTCP